VDERTKDRFLADTGSVYSLIPFSSPSPASGPRLVTADKKPVACWGSCTRTLYVGGRRFRWQFIRAAVAFPIVGADFLSAHNLSVDLANMKLVHSSERWSVPLSAPPSSGTFAAIGVQLMAPSPSRQSVGRQETVEDRAALRGGGSPGGQRGPTPWDVTPQPSPAEPAPISSTTSTAGATPPAAKVLPPPAAGSRCSGTARGGGPPDYQKVLESFPAVLNTSKQLPPAIHNVQHVIETTGRPISSRYRRLDPQKLAAAKKEFEELEKQGIVRRSSSSWSSPLHMVKKPDGTWRPCGDFRRLNLQTTPDRYTCPNMADLTSRLRGCTVFSKLDLRKGYHQVPVDEESIKKTAIITPFGLFEFLRMPFGLRNAGQTFQRMMDEVMNGLEYTFCYLDDILVASATPEEHVEHLTEVLARLERHGLVLNGEKCVLGVAEVEYLGHSVSASGIKPLPARVQAIRDFPRPQSTPQLQSFLGMANFYRRFVPAAAAVLKPLTDQLCGEKKATLVWTAQMDEAFLAVKKKLEEAVELAHPDPHAPLVLAVDASNTHVGGVLQQRDRRGALRPLGFFSVKLDTAQRKYSAFDRELLACYLSIRHFRWCVEGRQLHVLTDHKPLTFALHRLSDAWSARQQRQLSFIAEYTSDVQHVAGKENVVADALSRPACAVLPAPEGKVDLEKLAVAQATCRESLLWRDRENVQVIQVGEAELLCDTSTGGLRPVVPSTWRKRVFKSVHELAHAGTRATRRMVSSRFVWKGCATDVGAWCKDCVQCARGKVTRQEQASTEAIPVPRAAFSHVHVDLVGPLPATEKGHTYLLTMVDRTTRWPEAVPLHTISAEEVADTFVATWVARFGVPRVITTDRGTQFCSSTWKCLCRTLGAQHITTTAYHPQSNGLVERFHRQLKEALRARGGGAQWLEHLPWVLLGIRAAPKEESAVSAAEAVLGVPLQLPGQPLPVDRPNVREEEQRPVIPSTVRTYAEVVAHPQPSLQVGDMAYVRQGGARGPLDSTYSGPYQVLGVRGKAVQLQLGDRTDWLAVERLKRHVGTAEVEPARPPRRGRPRAQREAAAEDRAAL